MKGITIKLLVKTKTGEDGFKKPIYSESWVDVENVLIGMPTSEDIKDTLNLTEKHLAYVLSIPKGDKHVWNDTEVSFRGERFRTIGYPTEYMVENTPTPWNKEVKVERYG